MKDDGLPVDTDPRVLELVAAGGVKLLLLLCPSRVCRVGHVSKLGARTVLVVNSVNLVAVAPGGPPEKRRQRLAVLLDDPDRPAVLGCTHTQGELIDLPALQALAHEVETGARRRGSPVTVPVMS